MCKNVDKDFDLIRHEKIIKLKQAINLALKYLKISSRTSGRVRQYLIKNKIESAYIEATIKYLESKKYINDDLLAQLYIDKCSKKQSQSKKVLFYKMLNMGFKKESVEKALKFYDEEDAYYNFLTLTCKEELNIIIEDFNHHGLEALDPYKSKTVIKILRRAQARGFKYSKLRILLQKLVVEHLTDEI